MTFSRPAAVSLLPLMVRKKPRVQVSWTVCLSPLLCSISLMNKSVRITPKGLQVIWVGFLRLNLHTHRAQSTRERVTCVTAMSPTRDHRAAQMCVLVCVCVCVPLCLSLVDSAKGETSSRVRGLALWIEVYLMRRLLSCFHICRHPALCRRNSPPFFLSHFQNHPFSPPCMPVPHPHYLWWKASVETNTVIIVRLSLSYTHSLSPPLLLSLPLPCLVLGIAVCRCLQQCRGS